MKLSSICLGSGCLGLTLCAAAAQTQVILPAGSSPVVISFVMPQGADPDRLSFTEDGQLYTHADSVNPGDNLGSAMTGQLLATNGATPGGGLELHSRLPGLTPIVFGSVVDVDMFTTYTGVLQINSLAGNVGPLPFTPWNVTQIAPIAGYAQGFRFLHNSLNQADMQTGGGYYALLSAALSNPSDASGFYASSFGIQGFSTIQTTPEPGAMTLLSGLVVCGGMLWRKRRRTGSAC